MQPFREHPIDIAHLGTLFVLDKVTTLPLLSKIFFLSNLLFVQDKDGRFTETEFINFAQLFASKKNITADFQTHLQAFCTLRMWNEIGRGAQGVQLFEEWIGKLFTENSAELKTFKCK